MDTFNFSGYTTQISDAAKLEGPTLKRMLMKRLHVKTLRNAFEPDKMAPFYVRGNETVTLC